MPLPNKILKRVLISGVLGCLFCFFAEPELMAQSERDLVSPEENKTNQAYAEKPTLKDQRVSSEQDESSSDYSPLYSKKNSEKVPERKGGDKDAKNEEMSTLSFNLFLYVLDRFREDK
jgi:hypothetical protein